MSIIDSTKIELKIISETKQIDKIITLFQNILNMYNYNKKIISIVMPLILDEIIRNAIVHGNKKNKNKFIFVNASVSKEKIAIKIEDEGNGFDINKYLSNRQTIGKYSENGRGILIVENYVQELVFSKSGSCIEFVLNNQ